MESSNSAALVLIMITMIPGGMIFLCFTDMGFEIKNSGGSVSSGTTFRRDDSSKDSFPVQDSSLLPTPVIHQGLHAYIL